MSGQPAPGVTQIRFALTLATICAFIAVFGQGLQRWAGIAGVLLWLGVAKIIELRHRLARRRTPPD